MLWLYDHVPGVAPITEWAYRIVAAHRDFFYQVTRVLFGTHLEVPTFSLARWLFLKALGIVYLFAFWSFAQQALGLIGSKGILPANEFLQAVQSQLGARSYAVVPTIFWLNASNTFIQLLPLIGILLSILLIFGIGRRVMPVLLFVAYLSIVSAGQDFMSFQWDGLLLEAGFLAIFVGASTIDVWLFRWLLFRLMFLSGAVKLLSGDPNWHNLTALDYHFETQPLPTMLGYVAHQLPDGLHQLMTIGVFATELIVPFLIFTPRWPRMLAACAIIVLQVLIFLTGNYTFFNVLTIALCLFLFDDLALQRIAPKRLVDRARRVLSGQRRSLVGRRIAIGVAVSIGLVSGSQLIDIFGGRVPSPLIDVLETIAPFRIVNTYGLFAVMTTARHEIVVEGSNDGTAWLPYEFKYKPGDVSRPPLWVEPFQPRLDWQMWFAALGTFRQNSWFGAFLVRLLQGSPDVLALMDRNPFPTAPPKYVRAFVYDYHFTNFAKLFAQGAWWQRDRVGVYFPPIALSDLQ
jgi:hypothetical protein